MVDPLLKDVAAGGADACADVYCMPDLPKCGDGSALLAHLRAESGKTDCSGGSSGSRAHLLYRVFFL